MTPFPPVVPPHVPIAFPDPRRMGRRNVLAVGEDFRPHTLLSAYKKGIFPWPHLSPTGDRIVAWFSPNPRAIFELSTPPHWSRSLRRTLRHHEFEVTLDADFEQTIRKCGATREAEGTWIIPSLIEGYLELHRLGWAHSVEVWQSNSSGRELVGGIYGVAVGGYFAGESMFHTVTDASKIAFASLVDRLRASGFQLFDVQVQNDHLASLGCVEIPRLEFLTRVAEVSETSRRLLPFP